MDRVMISMNVPNLITVNLMAWAGFLAFIIAYQFIAKGKGKSGNAAPSSSGADQISDLGGY